nr:ribonuclease H-like domain-containing protein [Tanacetum cinerariifolium]
MVSSVKLPTLKKCEYILWTIKMEQYLAHTDYALWEVILNESTSNTNELNAAYSVSTATCHSSQAQGSSSYADKLIDYRSARNSKNRSRDAMNAGYRGRDNEEEATDFAFMAFTSNPSSFSSLNSELDEALREKEDLKAKLEKFETSSKNLTNLLDRQISAKVKTGLGYDSQFNEKEVLDIKGEEVTETVFDNRLSDEENSLANGRFKKDDSIYKFKISETVASLTKDEKDAIETSTACVEKPKDDRSSALIIQDWDTDSDDESVFRSKPIPPKIDFMKAALVDAAAFGLVALTGILPDLVNTAVGEKLF